MRFVRIFALSLAFVRSFATAADWPLARLLPIAGDGFSGSSVNVVAGLQHTLWTEGRVQYAAFYAADGVLVLARRQLGGDAWQSIRTPYRGTVADAHRTIALAVDGEGYLHVAWDHHGTPLRYARSIAPGSLELRAPEKMTGLHEAQVTYPCFYRLPEGGLLFLYRDGVSGRGNLVLNSYATVSRKWQQVHANLIDGEGKRSAYPSATIDRKGVFHLAWNWRESADVATNHDLCYARSADGGKTWTTSADAPLPIPITVATAEYAARIPPESNLMNPPAIAADEDGQPYLADFWSDGTTGIPQYRLVRREGAEWRVSQITQRTGAFTLRGTATKHPPISRAALFVSKAGRRPANAHLVYRDDARGGGATILSSKDIAVGEWSPHDLTTDTLGAWEPSADPVQWQRMKQIHFLVQRVEQRDGDDAAAADTTPTSVATLIWSPFAPVAAAEISEPPASPPAGALDRKIVASEALKLMERAADWQLAQTPTRDPRGWENAPFYIGALALAQLSESTKYHDAILARCEETKWEPAPRTYHADDYCVTQAYLQLHRRHREPRMLDPSKARFDGILAKPAKTPLDWGSPGSQERWSWCDALFMGPASWLMMAEATGDARYVDFMNREWWLTTETLYVKGDRFFARDESYLDVREPNGRRLYWARGNGWVAAGLSRVLDLFPKTHADYPRYVALYGEMMDAVLAAQQPDGLWRPGLLDPGTHRARETSGSSFYTFALAWGINRGLLDRDRCEPAVRRAWNALSACIAEDGKLEHVQPIGAAPEGFDPHHSEPFGVGAFLLAGSEVYRLAGGGKAGQATH